MDKLIIILIIAVIANVAVGLSFRHKRQSSDDEENNLEDRYGWDRPQGWGRPQGWDQRPTRRPNRRPNQWPNQEWQQNPNGNPWAQNQGQQTTRNPNGSGSTTTQSISETDCISRCLVTSEYNPVCGTNSVTYQNPGRLSCAQSCGVNVNLARSAPCPTTTTVTPPSG